MAFLDASARHFERFWVAGAELRTGGPVEGFLQQTPERTRVVAAVLLLIAVTTTSTIGILLLTFLLTVTIAVVSYLNVGSILKRVAAIVAVFTLPLALLASISLVTPGNEAVRIGGVTLTVQGLKSGLFLLLRALNAVTITMVLVYSAGLHGVIRGLRQLGMSAQVAATLQLSIHHIHLLGRTAYGMIQGLKARNLVTPTMRNAYVATSNQATTLLGKSVYSSKQVHAAMLARGFEGEFPTEEQQPRAGARDVAIICIAMLAAVAGVMW